MLDRFVRGNALQECVAYRDKHSLFDFPWRRCNSHGRAISGELCNRLGKRPQIAQHRVPAITDIRLARTSARAALLD